VGNRELPGFVINIEENVFTKVLERDFRSKAGAEVPNLVRPLLEFLVVRHAAVQRDRFVLGAARGFPAAARIAAFAVFDDLGRALKCAAFADASNMFAVPSDPELEVFVGIEPVYVDGELGYSHKFLLV